MTQKELAILDAVRLDVQALDKKLLKAIERIGVLEQEAKELRRRQQPVNAISRQLRQGLIQGGGHYDY